MKLGVIVNPTARGGRAARTAAKALARLGERASAIEVVERADPDATALARLRDEAPDAIVVIGGDGTVHQAVNTLAGSGIPLGIIPAGTGNDFAASIGIPKDLLAAADIVFDGVTAHIDLAEATDIAGAVRHFATILASGFDSKVNDLANRIRWPRGRGRYNVAIAVEFARLAPCDLAVSWVDEAGNAGATAGPLMLAAVGNTARYGGGIPICAGADPRDGLLDLVMVHPAGRAKLVKVLAAAFQGTHGAHRLVEVHRVREVSLASPNLTGYADGDRLGPLPLRVRALPGALALRLPQSGQTPETGGKGGHG